MLPGKILSFTVHVVCFFHSSCGIFALWSLLAANRFCCIYFTGKIFKCILRSLATPALRCTSGCTRSPHADTSAPCNIAPGVGYSGYKRVDPIISTGWTAIASLFGTHAFFQKMHTQYEPFPTLKSVCFGGRRRSIELAALVAGTVAGTGEHARVCRSFSVGAKPLVERGVLI